MIERDDSKLLQLRNQIRDGTVYDAESLSRNLNNDQRFALISVYGKAVDVDVRSPDQITPAECTIIVDLVDLVDQLIATVEAIRQAVADRGPARSTTRVAREYVRSLPTFGAAEARCDGVAPEVAEEVLNLVVLRVAPFAENVKWLAGFSSGLIAVDIDEGRRRPEGKAVDADGSLGGCDAEERLADVRGHRRGSEHWFSAANSGM